MQKRLFRSGTNRVFGGVAGGLGKYFGIDAIIFRILFVLLVISNGLGILAYIIFWIVLPENYPVYENIAEGGDPDIDKRMAVKERGGQGKNILGALLIVIGLVLLIDELFYIDLSELFPIALIVVGVVLLTKEYNKNQVRSNGKN